MPTNGGAPREGIRVGSSVSPGQHTPLDLCDIWEPSWGWGLVFISGHSLESTPGLTSLLAESTSYAVSISYALTHTLVRAC